MCNTWSKVYLQSMNTYILSVNTLMWNLTLERHDNCAPCLGLIFPIRWVTPPPHFLENSHLASWMHYLHIWFVFNIGLSSRFIFAMLSWSSLLYINVFCPLQHSLIPMSSNLLFSELSECDRTLTPYVLIPQVPSISSYAFCWHVLNVFIVPLSAEDVETHI